MISLNFIVAVLTGIVSLGFIVQVIRRVRHSLRVAAVQRDHVAGKPRLGYEAIDEKAFALRTRPTFFGTTGLASDTSGRSPNATLNAVANRSNAFAQSLYKKVKPSPRVSPNQSATRLVNGIASLHDVTLFAPTTLPADPADPSVIIRDLLGAIGITPRLVDVSSDAEMYMGLPPGPNGPDLPQLYIKGAAVGGADTVLRMVQSSTLANALVKAGIPFDAIAASELRLT